ncbi:MAG TPA: hypothetical protein VLG73_02220, partial [Shinella sp.]|nr:hypothetical protein [Shinella sp.]
MADKNLARSGTADTDLLADDDPLAELARLVGYEPRPVQDAGRPSPEPVQAAPRMDNPVLALEDELMRAFEQYDAPRRESVEPVIAERATPQHVEPVFDMPEPVAEARDAILDEVPTRDDVPRDVAHHEPSFEEQFFYAEPSFEEEAPVAAEQPDVAVSDVAFDAPAAEPSYVQEAIVQEAMADAQPADVEPELDFDPALLLA